MAGMVLGLVDRFSRRSACGGGWSDGVLVGLGRLVRLWLARICVLGFAFILAVVNGIGWGALVWGVWVGAGYLESRRITDLQRRNIRTRLSSGRSHPDTDTDTGPRSSGVETGWSDLAGGGLGGRGASVSCRNGFVGTPSGGPRDRELG